MCIRDSYHTLQAYLRYTPHLRAAQKALPAPEAGPAAAGDEEPAVQARLAAPVPLVEATLVPD